MSSEILPPKCKGCKLTGMEAIACGVFPLVPQALEHAVQCATAHLSPEVFQTTGEKYVGDEASWGYPASSFPIAQSRRPYRNNHRGLI